MAELEHCNLPVHDPPAVARLCALARGRTAVVLIAILYVGVCPRMTRITWRERSRLRPGEPNRDDCPVALRPGELMPMYRPSFQPERIIHDISKLVSSRSL